ncbi:hypothetical protein KIN20_032245 [Parelaphostrongylus tenuis]|uniref:Uncharacterized protein n=1 Tax=Parelaphostrongylus tenuis TaxID=148309 RepID=A0AAD5R8I7_PARTN|nr:hypothetical protein KIN20_032245 [Parelaphostrongylus tenuis]
MHRLPSRTTNHAKAQKSVSKQTAFRFLAEFCTGSNNLEDLLHFGHPQEVDHEAVIEAIGEESDIDYRRVGHRILKAENRKWKRGRWIPHELTARVPQLMRRPNHICCGH